MNAFQAQQLVVNDYQQHLDYAFDLIKERSKQGFYSVRIKEGIWTIDSDLTRTVFRKLEREGYRTHLTSDRGTGLTHTTIMW